MKKVIEETMVGNTEYTPISIDYLTAAGNKALAEKVKAMSDDELEIVVDNIPVDLCLKRIQKELAKHEDLVNALKNVSIML